MDGEGGTRISEERWEVQPDQVFGVIQCMFMSSCYLYGHALGCVGELSIQLSRSFPSIGLQSGFAQS